MEGEPDYGIPIIMPDAAGNTYETSVPKEESLEEQFQKAAKRLEEDPDGPEARAAFKAAKDRMHRKAA